jgi:hypothetical protein
MTTISLRCTPGDMLVDVDVEAIPNAEFFWQVIRDFGRASDEVALHPEQPRPTLERFLRNAERARELFGFQWDVTQFSQEDFNAWHKDIETFDLSRHPPWSQEKGDFFIELHNSLHAAEKIKHLLDQTHIETRPFLMQVRWHEHSRAWLEPARFCDDQNLERGDIIAGYPHVGKSPEWCMQDGDDINLAQTCRLPDACPCGFLINFETHWHTVADRDRRRQRLLEWYDKHADQLGMMFDREKMLQYHGFYRLGRIRDLSMLSELESGRIQAVEIL